MKPRWNRDPLLTLAGLESRFFVQLLNSEHWRFWTHWSCWIHCNDIADSRRWIESHSGYWIKRIKPNHRMAHLPSLRSPQLIQLAGSQRETQWNCFILKCSFQIFEARDWMWSSYCERPGPALSLSLSLSLSLLLTAEQAITERWWTAPLSN